MSDTIIVETDDENLDSMSIWIDDTGPIRTGERIYSFSLESTEQGRHLLTAVALDRAGNSASSRIEFFLDREPPIIRPSSFEDNGTYPPGLSLVFDVKDIAGVAQVFLSIDGSSPHRLDDRYLFILPRDIAPGKHRVVIKAKDALGNAAERTYTIFVTPEEKGGTGLTILLFAIALISAVVIICYFGLSRRDR
jgi:hypothetical protein